MKHVDDLARDFVRRAAKGGPVAIKVGRGIAALLVAELIRAGFDLAQGCLESIKDDALRDRLLAIVGAAAAGAAIGAGVGFLAGGPGGAAIGGAAGALLGAGLGVMIVREMPDGTVRIAVA